LFIRNPQNTHLAFGRQTSAHPFHVHLGVFLAGTMAQVHGKLHLCESVLEQVLAKAGIILPVGFGRHRQVEKDKQPHNSVRV